MVRTENQSVSGFELYGFAEEQERDLFEKLYSVSGISAATARVILSSLRPQEVVQAILTENEAAIQRIKGIGPKLAKRMILELKDKIGKTSAEDVLLPSAGHTVRQEALTALQALGFNKQAVEKELSRLMPQRPDWSLEGLIKEALRHL
jgi:Holliday junction DNA helicase RuvA